MSDLEVLSLLREFLWSAALISMPLLIAALAAGIVVGLLQALTSIQELTLTFVPKLAIMLVVFFICSGYMARVMLGLFENEVLPVIAR